MRVEPHPFMSPPRPELISSFNTTGHNLSIPMHPVAPILTKETMAIGKLLISFLLETNLCCWCADDAWTIHIYPNTIVARRSCHLLHLISEWFCGTTSTTFSEMTSRSAWFSFFDGLSAERRLFLFYAWRHALAIGILDLNLLAHPKLNSFLMEDYCAIFDLWLHIYSSGTHPRACHFTFLDLQHYVKLGRRPMVNERPDRSVAWMGSNMEPHYLWNILASGHNLS